MKLQKHLLILVLSVFAIFSCTVNKTEPGALPRSTPEEEGVSSQAILNFVEAVENSKHELHSFMIVRHGNVAAEGWWNPYKPELKHTMYSTSKSFTSTAIGLAVSENLISVSDKVISFFPEDLPDTISENLADLEIRDLLSMTFGQDPEPPFPAIVGSENWVKSILANPIVNKPGSVFLYNSFGTYLLAAIIHKVTGENVVDYLKPRLFEPLGITGADWEVDPMGINTGGWGLRIKTEDMAKLGQLYLQHGKWNGVQILPEEWVEEATTSKILQSPELSQEDRQNSDWLQGYGYKFWRSRHNSFRGDGAYGQFILVLPEQDAVIAITAETSDMQGELNLVWENLLPGFQNEKLAANTEIYNELKEKLNSLALMPPKVETGSSAKFLFDKKSFNFTGDGNLKGISFNFENDNCKAAMIFANNRQTEFVFGANNWVYSETNIPVNSLAAQPNDQILKLAPFKIVGAYSFPDENSIELTVRYIESPHTDYYLCKVNGDSISVEISNSRTQRKSVENYNG
ncbi:MAG TPA: serine hydrolase, partial [Draconibacterium sp.]|nr:serine hydrolase [Draconibacterium sp.]